MLMYKSILMNLEVFPIFIFSPPNLTLKIPKIAMKKFFGALLWSKIVLFFHHHCQDTDKKNLTDYHVSKITFLGKISRIGLLTVSASSRIFETYRIYDFVHGQLIVKRAQ